MATVELLEKKLKGRERPADSIRCSRCSGFMIVEGAFDSMLSSAGADCLVRRCVQCGEVVDPVILQNRRLHQGSERERIKMSEPIEG
ncbi:MAG: hypothetical protein KF722_10895 [Nitrospira sp.]|nr:hypothetical protein [Nitrospira sp.]